MIYLGTIKNSVSSHHYFYIKNWIFYVYINTHLTSHHYYRWEHKIDSVMENCDRFHYTLPENLVILDINDDDNYDGEKAFYLALDNIITNKILENI